MMNEKQKEKVIALFKEYQEVDKQARPGGVTFAERHQRRLEVGAKIEKEVDQFLAGRSTLQNFKWAVDSLNKKKNNHWGFGGWKGMVFFNLLASCSDKFPGGFESLLRKAITVPANDSEAIQKIESFFNEVEKVTSSYEDRRKGPNPSATPYFLTYFWYIQEMEMWPVQYPSSESAFSMLGLWNRTGKTVEDARTFLAASREMHSVIQESERKAVPLSEVGHAIYDYYLKRKDPSPGPAPIEQTPPTSETEVEPWTSRIERGLPESYIPPVVSILPQMARMDPEIEELCNSEGKDLPTEFEQRVAAAFQLLGFKTEVRGQGHGREPDVIATCEEHHYKIIVDAKARREPYKIGTDSRKFIEYIGKEAPVKGMDKVYFAIVSSEFSGSKDPEIKVIKSQTKIHGVVMSRADDLLTLLGQKLQNPDFDLGPSGFLGLLSEDGVIDIGGIG